MSTDSLTVGRLDPEDDLMHPVSDDSSHNESMFFNFFDSELEIGGFVRIGNRLNEGHAEMSFVLFLPNGDLLMQWGRPNIDTNDVFDAAGMRFEVIDPGRTIHITFDGEAGRIADPYEMVNPGQAMRTNPKVAVHLDLEMTEAGPMIGDRAGDPDGAIIVMPGCGHYQQPNSLVGTLRVDDESWDLNMRGIRDHSWGKRVWASLYQDRSIWISFGRDLSFIACKTVRGDGTEPDEMGCVIENGKVTPLRSIVVNTRWPKGSYYHDAITLDLEDVEGRTFELVGEVLAYVPLRHRTPGKDTVYLGQAMTRFQLGDRSTVGLSEYFDAEPAAQHIADVLSQSGEHVAE